LSPTRRVGPYQTGRAYQTGHAYQARVGPFLAGFGTSLAGHIATLVAMYAAGSLGPLAFGMGQAVLLATAVPSATASMHQRPQFGAGLLTGWLVGFLSATILATIMIFGAGA
jgi:hypothetical protein